VKTLAQMPPPCRPTLEVGGSEALALRAPPDRAGASVWLSMADLSRGSRLAALHTDHSHRIA